MTVSNEGARIVHSIVYAAQFTQISFHNTKLVRYETYTSAKIAEISERKGQQHSLLKNIWIRKPGLDIHTAVLLDQSTDLLSRECASILHKLPSYASDTGACSKNSLEYSNLDQLFKSLSPFELMSTQEQNWNCKYVHPVAFLEEPKLS